MSDKEPTIQRVINFLYDALDRFKDTMNELNQNVASLMGSLEKARGDLSGTGVSKTVTNRSAILSTISKRGPQSSSSSREKLIALLSGQATVPPKPATPAAVGPPRPPAAVGAPRPPAAVGPPRPPAAVGPPRPPAAVGAPRPPAAVGPPRPAAVGPPRPAAVGPPRPAAVGAPRPPVAPGPSTAGLGSAGGAPTISGLRDEMLKELKRLKAIMKGEK
ncbi:MAG: hypothetical protein ACFFD2_01260 [Promethearchaeota archaeon]